MPKSKKGRLSATERKNINIRRATDAISGHTPGVLFARIVKMTGANHVRVAIATKHGPRELIARIPNIFARRGVTPITTRDIVGIYVGDDFNPDTYDTSKTSDHFDITAILNAKQIGKLVEDGEIPSWMNDIEVSGSKINKETTSDVGYVFDYSAISEKDEEISDVTQTKRKDVVYISEDEDALDVDDI